MSDKFLNTGGGGGANISNGTVNAFLASLTVANLSPSLPVKTNSVNTLISTKLDIADVNNLEGRLDAIDDKTVNIPNGHNPFIYTTGPPINQDVNRVYLDDEFNFYARSDAGFPKPSELPNYYTGVVYNVDSEAQLTVDLITAADYDILNITADITLTTGPITINKKLKIQSLNGSRITLSWISYIFQINVGEVWFDGLTFNNINLGSSANILNFSGLNNTKNFVTNCTFETNEFAITSNNNNIQITNNVFKFVGVPDSHRYIFLTGCRGYVFINDNIFQGNGSSTQCININNSIPANFQDGHLVIKNNVSQILAVQRLLMVDISLAGSNLSLYVSSNNCITTSGFIIFYSLPLSGVKQIYLYNNVETLAPGITGSKGIIGIDSPGPSVIAFDTKVYSADNIVPELRIDYTDLINPDANQPRVIAYATSKFSPVQLYDVIVPFIKNLSGGSEDAVKNPFESDVDAAGFSITNLTNINGINVDDLGDKTQYMSAPITLPPQTKFLYDVEADSFIKTGGTNQQYLMADGSSLQYSANSGNSNFYLYVNKTTLDPNPPDGDITYNNATQSLATEIYISHRTRDDIDIEVFFKNISQLQDVYIQDQAISENYIRYNITGPPVLTIDSKVTIPVAAIESMGTGSTSFGNNKHILLSFFTNNIETDLRISTLETKTQNITATPGITSMAGRVDQSATGTLTYNINCDRVGGVTDLTTVSNINYNTLGNNNISELSARVVVNARGNHTATNRGSDYLIRTTRDNEIGVVQRLLISGDNNTYISGGLDVKIPMFRFFKVANTSGIPYFNISSEEVLSQIKHVFASDIEPFTNVVGNIGSLSKRFDQVFCGTVNTNVIQSGSSSDVRSDSAIFMNNNKIISVGNPTANGDAANKLYVDNSVLDIAERTQNITASQNQNNITGVVGIRLQSSAQTFRVTDNNNPFYTTYMTVSSTGIFSEIKHTFTNLIEPLTDLGVLQNIGSVSKRFNTLFCNTINSAKVVITGAPVANTDATNKLYVDNSINSLANSLTSITSGTFAVQWTGVTAGGTTNTQNITWKRISDGTNTVVWLTLRAFTVTIGTTNSNFGVLNTVATVPANLLVANSPNFPICAVFNNVVQTGWLVHFGTALGIQPNNRSPALAGTACGISQTSVVSYMI